jgi:hypothetical protein
MKSVYDKATVTNTRPLVQLSIDQAVKKYYAPKNTRPTGIVLFASIWIDAPRRDRDRWVW